MLEVVEGLDEPLRRRAFERRSPFPAEATTDDHWVASWLRMPPPAEKLGLRDRDGAPVDIGFYDGVSVWSDGYVNVGPRSNTLHARVEWRDSPLDPDEFACLVTAVIDQWDRFVPHTGPRLQRRGWTRD